MNPKDVKSPLDNKALLMLAPMQGLTNRVLRQWFIDHVAPDMVFTEFMRVIKDGGSLKLYPLFEWRYLRIKNTRLREILSRFKIEQTFVHGGRDWRVTPSMLTHMTKA